MVEPVAGEFFVEEGIVRGKRESPDKKQTQSQPHKQGRRDMFVRGSREHRFGKEHQVLAGGDALTGFSVLELMATTSFQPGMHQDWR